MRSVFSANFLGLHQARYWPPHEDVSVMTQRQHHHIRPAPPPTSEPEVVRGSGVLNLNLLNKQKYM
jgi:hypothetical protein